MSYTILKTDQDVVIKRGDGAHIPSDMRNADYREYLAWVVAGNKPVIEMPPDASVEELRKEEYNKRGVTLENMIVALWEAQVEGKSEALEELQAIRAQVKEDIPKSLDP